MNDSSEKTEDHGKVTAEDFMRVYGHCQVALRDSDMHPEYVTLRDLFAGFTAAMEPKKAPAANTAKKSSKSSKSKG